MLAKGMRFVLTYLFQIVLVTSTVSASEQYAKGNLIVKYKDYFPVPVERLFQKHRSFESYLGNAGLSLDALHRKYHVQEVQPIFRNVSEDNDSFAKELDKYQISHSDSIRKKYPRRTARILAEAHVPHLYHVYLLTLPQNIDIRQAAAEFSLDPNVIYAEPNYIMNADMLPNDPYFTSSGSWGQSYSDLWAIKSNKLNLPKAWEISQGDNITVAVVDTGIDYNHPDIQQNVWHNSGEIRGNHIDDDGNGFVDDTIGWNFVQGPGQRQWDPLDDNGHGTHVSGTIAAVGNNDIGIIGVAPHAKLMPVKALDADGSGTSVALGRAVLYAVYNGADVINNSWSCSYCPSNPVMEEVVSTAYAMGVVVVFSAGNDQCDVAVKSPQNMTIKKPIVAAASNEQDEPAFFTCFGAQVDVTAPGGGSNDSPETVANILSLKANKSHFDPKLNVGKQYLRLAGTSMAAPHVSGVAALMLSNNGSLKNEDVRLLLRATAKDINKPNFDESTGAGRIDAAAALKSVSVLNVKLLSPRSGSNFSQLKNVIVVRGTAQGAELDSAGLFYRSVKSSDWISLSPPRMRSFNNEEIGRWNISKLPSGVYLLMLAAKSKDGLCYEDVVEVGLDHLHRLINTKSGSLPVIDAGRRPRVSGNLIVWEDTGNSRGINVFDLSRNQQQLIWNVGTGPDISGMFIVAAWANGREAAIYDMATKDTTHFQMNGTAWGMRITNHELVWNTSSIAGRDISHCTYEPQTGSCQISRITNDPRIQQYPEVSERAIVWEDYRNVSRAHPVNVDIYLYDFGSKSEFQVTTNTSKQIQPQISGNTIVWMDNRNQNWDIYSCTFDVQTGTCPEQQITRDTSDQLYPSISGNHIVWVDYRSGNPDIFDYDIETRIERQVTFSTKGQFYPRISGNNVIWLEIDSTESVRIYQEAF